MSKKPSLKAVNRQLSAFKRAENALWGAMYDAIVRAVGDDAEMVTPLCEFRVKVEGKRSGTHELLFKSKDGDWVSPEGCDAEVMYRIFNDIFGDSMTPELRNFIWGEDKREEFHIGTMENVFTRQI